MTRPAGANSNAAGPKASAQPKDTGAARREAAS
jgi:hypothetical protein